jgi:hypothetical protein
MSRLRTFKHRFRGGAIVEVSVDYDNIGSAGDWEHRWSGKRRKPSLISEYKRRFLSVLQQVANETGRKSVEVLRTEARVYEMWLFEPGKTPVKVRNFCLAA